MATNAQDLLTRTYSQRFSLNVTSLYSYGNSVTIQSGLVHRLGIRTSFGGPLVEIPCYCTQAALFHYRRCLNLEPLSEVVIPLFCGRTSSDGPSYKSASPILKYCLNSHWEYGLQPVKGNDWQYYGSRGLILYGDMTPLIMFTTEYSVQQDGILMPETQICRLSPRVFTDLDIISKNIRNKFLGEILSVDVENMYFGMYQRQVLHSRCAFADVLDNHTLDYKLKVIVEPMDKFFVRPETPSVECSPENMAQFIHENATQIISQ